MRAIVMAAGDGVRWGHHLGIPKHLVPVDGEVLLERTVRQMHDRGCEVVILSPPDDRYYVPGARAVAPRFTDWDTDKFLSTFEWWLPDGPTVIVYGDAYLSDDAADALTSGKPLSWVGRSGPSTITGCEWGEMFGVTVQPAEHGRLAAAVLKVRGLLTNRTIWRGGGWEVYRATQGLDLHPEAHDITRDFTEIDDWSDDFDFPDDYDRWCARRASVAA